MRQRILENLTTTERLTLLEQIFAPGAGARLEQSDVILMGMGIEYGLMILSVLGKDVLDHGFVLVGCSWFTNTR